MRGFLGRAVVAAGLVLSSGCGVEPTAPVVSSRPRGAQVASQEQALSPASAALSRWSPLVTLPLVPVSAANLPDGRVLLWSAEDRFGFDDDLGRTYTVTFDPANNTASERLVSETGHDMFCPGTANLADGRILVNGGLSSAKTSIYNPLTNSWTAAGNMNIPRAYQGTVPLEDGAVLTLGGSWAGGVGNKHGELWTEATGWRRLSGVPIDPFLSVDATRNFGMDSHLWLFSAGNGRVFHVGPGINMNWINTTGNGSVTRAGRRAADEFSINGSATMYDVGKILKTGGGPGYEGVNANANSYVIDINGGLQTRKVQSMAYRRAFHNSVVLPNGQVVIVGGMTYVVGFSDSNAVLAPELFDPLTETFVALPAMAVPRNYHSIALLLPDARVLSAGGGLCGSGCAANHANLQILSPHYLFNADGTPAVRPTILSAPSQANHGTTIAVSTDSQVSSFVLIRASSATHAVNNDQRRLPVSSRDLGGNNYELSVPSNPGWALPGQYMLFALDAAGVPSVARMLRVGTSGAPRILPVEDYGSTVGADTTLALQTAQTAGATLSFSATGLPPGLSIDSSTGLIAGITSNAGRFVVEASVSDGLSTTSSQFVWTVSDPGNIRFVRLEALSELNGAAWSSVAELNLLDDNGQPLPRGGWTISADSAETVGQAGQAANAIDGNPNTIWHSQWQAAAPPPPHQLTVDLGGSYRVAGLRYLPRQDASPNGTIAQYRVYLSADGNAWGPPVSEGNFAALGAVASEKVIYFQNVARGKLASQSSNNGAALAGRAVDGNTSGLAAGNSLSMTTSQASAFWEVDLAGSYQLYGVRLWNRTDGTDTLNNFYVLASELPMTGSTLAQLLADPQVVGVQVSGASGAVNLLNLAGRARYVRVQLAGTAALQLAEVEVFGRVGNNRAPTMAQLPDLSLVTGSQVAQSAGANDLDGDPLSYLATGLPPGLSIHAGTGLISGTASQLGSYPVSVSVSDGRGGAASSSAVWFVGVSVPALNPVAAPAVLSGGTASYSASTSNVGLFEYQWSFGDGSPDSGFSGQSTITHSFGAPGVYTVTLTIRNSEGAASSRQFLQAVNTPASGVARASSNLALEPRSSGNPRLWVVNPDANSVSVFDAVTLAKLREITVGNQPRSLALASDGRIWVVNKGSSSLSIINPSTFAIASTVGLPRGAQPYGIVFGTDNNAYVTLEATGRLLKLNNSGSTLSTLELGSHIRHLSLTAQGDRLLVSRFITKPQPGEATGFVQSNVDGVQAGAELLVVTPSNLTLQRTIILRHSDREDSTIAGRGVPNYLGAAAISPDGTSAWVPGKQDNIARGTLRDGRNLDFQNTLRAISSRVDLASLTEDYAARVDHDNAGLASAAVYHSNGAYLFVALETSRQLAVLDARGKRELFRVDTGRAPQGVLVSADGRSLFLHNFMDRSVGVYDLRPLLDFGEVPLPLRATLASVASETLSAQVLRGKQLFYDARDTRLARDAYISCASCHNDGAQDGRTWDFTGMGEGLRNTISLRGRAGAQGRLHWSANFDEVQDFEGQLRSLCQGTGLLSDGLFFAETRSTSLGTPKAGLSTDLDALSAYLTSLNSFEVSPLRSTAGALTGDAVTGRTVFANRCVSCHIGTDFSDSTSLSTRSIGTVKSSSGGRLGAALVGIDTPTLRDVLLTAPYLHDGSAASVEAAISAHTGLTLTASELASVAAFTRQIGSEEPAVAIPLAAGSGLTGQYFGNSALTGPALLTRSEAVNFTWGTAVPAPGVAADNYSARWTGSLYASSAGAYRFQTVSDAGARMWINGKQVINAWTSHSSRTDSSADVNLTAGSWNDVIVEYYETTGSATMRLLWRTPSAWLYSNLPQAQLYPGGVGLRGEYFDNVDLAGPALLTRTEAINLELGTGGPGGSLPADFFSARWTGQLAPVTSGVHRLQTNSDDGVRVWLNNTLLIDNWQPHGPTLDTSPALNLTAGQRYTLRVEYNEHEGGATMQLLWLAPSTTSYSVIPASRLYE